jgi:spore germination protein YaaH
MKKWNTRVSILLVLALFLLSSPLVYAKQTRSSLLPSAPTNLAAINLTSSSATLNWSTVSGASGYKVYKATPYDSNYTLLATISTNTYSTTGLTASNNYWYFVKAYNSHGTSADSIHLKVATPQATILQPSKTILGFATYYYSGDASSYNSMLSNTSLINEIATNTYTTDGLGNISGLVPTNQINYANSNGIKPLAMITNNFDGNIAKSLLESSANRQTLISNTLSALKTNGYKGVNVDLEGVFYYDRSYLTTFISELYSTLHNQGFYVTMAVPAKTSDSSTNSWNGAYDYAALANYSDQLVLMTYDEHYPGGTPGPIASIGWVESVIKYAITVIPKEKLLLGTSAYGYDWSSNGTKAYSISDINNLATTYNSIILWDSVSKSPYFSYVDSSGINHNVWFENSTSLAYKLDLVNTYNLSGIGIWRLGLENADYWTTIKIKFNK